MSWNNDEADSLKKALQQKSFYNKFTEQTMDRLKQLKEDLRDQLARNEATMVDTDGKRQIRGTFYMVQADVLNPEYLNDRFGRATVQRPARSIFLTYEDAERCCKHLAKQTGRAFFILKTERMIEVDSIKYKETML
jgi:tRNA1(Val) A37 N6-methylase TrmN6